MPVVHKYFLRMPALRTTEFGTVLESLDRNCFCDALQYAFGYGLGLYSSPSRPVRFLRAIAKRYEGDSRLDWRGGAESPLNNIRALNREAEQAAG
jgi:hypothetical protein